MELYVTQPGDTLSSVAARFGVSPVRLAADNGLPENAALAVGQALVVLTAAAEHTVSPGETLFSIAARYGTTVNQMLRNNPILAGRSELTPGQTLVLSFDEPRIGSFVVTGYAYPYITDDILRRTLPYLTYLSIFGYGITADGGLVDLDDERVLRFAREYGVGAVMLLCALNDEGGFSSENLSAVLADPAAQRRLMDSVLETMEEKGYVGLDLDFEYVFPADRERYADFVAYANQRVSEQGYFLLTALAPKTRADQPGLLYEAHDYAAIGKNSDYVLLMTYEWGYGRGPAMAVAPLNKVTEVVDYAVTVIPAYKINLGIPNYGYDWPQPFVRGESVTPSIGNAEATELAVRVGAEIQFDPLAQSPFFFYTEDGVVHEVWFEDGRSLNAKYTLAREKGLRGLGFWSIMRWYQPAWSVLNARYTIARAAL